uniref:Transcription intermediary factor 1-beta n=1 Tax=Magallana gigas TaxID=29159 RepID=K1PQH4_MAGGI
MHTFCHNCLSSYILSKCKTKESPVGFPCPLCRRFVPAPSFSVEIEKWTELIPVNGIAKVLSENVNKFCDACTRADEEIEATDWCESCSELLCASCVKYHKRNAICKNHVLISLATFDKVSENQSLESAEVFCQNHSNKVEFLCVDHKELCCTRCVSTTHRKCNQIDDIVEAAENLRKLEKLNFLSKEISKYDETLVKAKSEGRNTVKYIDDTADKIKQESTELRDKIVNHIDALLENLLSELAQSVKQSKDQVEKFVDDISDRHILMTQYLQTLKDTCTTQAPPSIVVFYYFKIIREFKHVTKSSPSRLRLSLHSDVSKDLTRVLEVEKFSDIQTEPHLVPLCGIDFANTRMELIGELNGSEGGVTGGCFLENGDIVLAYRDSNRMLQYNKLELKRERNMEWIPRDVVCQSPSLLFISKNKPHTKGCVEKFDMEKFAFIEDKFLETNIVYSLAISSGFVYAACSDSIVKFDSEGNIVKRYEVKKRTTSVAINKSDEIISSNCTTNYVTVMNDSGEKLHSYFHKKLKYPYGLDVNFSGNIFVVGSDSNNIHILSPKAELLKIFDIESPKCIKFKENSYVCFVGSEKKTTKLYKFLEDM